MPPKILVVDDDESIVFMLKEMLQADGYEVETSSDSRVALDRIANFQPNLLILDFNMPGVSGSQALDTIRANPATQSLPVLFLSGEPPEKILPKGGNALTGCLTKPIELDDLSAAVGKMLKKS